MAEYLTAFREYGSSIEVEGQPLLCWFLLNGDTRACIKERGHDNGVHETSVKACPDPEDHAPHPWTEKHQCEAGAG